MRRTFANLLLEEMKINDRIVVITADLGFGLWDTVQQEFPGRFYNCGAAEQLMVGMGIGLALAGHIPVCYSITPFLLYRPFEFIRNYLNCEKIAVKLVGSGRNKDYENEGFSHHAEDDLVIMKCFSNIITYHPDSKEELCSIFQDVLYNSSPVYVNLKK
ncbi:MAG: hypothetical protein M0R80_08285 [Proteobacteria bacterium]|jgi:transketolase|nr:hypothetical protein [Pseudomonadota bacterium]